jgi:hypothetical protein
MGDQLLELRQERRREGRRERNTCKWKEDGMGARE